MICTAHVSEVVGTYSELVAQIALLANGWRIHESKTAEPYDILATDPLKGDHAKIQVKTIRQREDRRGDLVVYAKKGDHTTYDLADVDYFIGVWAADGEIPRVYMFENQMRCEYWAPEAKASERWIELPIALDRSVYSAQTQESA